MRPNIILITHDIKTLPVDDVAEVLVKVLNTSILIDTQTDITPEVAFYKASICKYNLPLLAIVRDRDTAQAWLKSTEGSNGNIVWIDLTLLNGCRGDLSTPKCKHIRVSLKDIGFELENIKKAIGDTLTAASESTRVDVSLTPSLISRIKTANACATNGNFNPVIARGLLIEIEEEINKHE